MLRLKNKFRVMLAHVMMPRNEHLFVLMDANARTGKQGGEIEVISVTKVIRAYRRETLDDNGGQRLSCVDNHDLTTVNTSYSTTNRLHTSNGRGSKRIGYILTRQPAGCIRALLACVFQARTMTWCLHLFDAIDDSHVTGKHERQSSHASTCTSSPMIPSYSWRLP